MNQTLTASGTAASEGLLTRSVDGRYVVLTGYDAAVGTASVAGTASTAVNRVVGRVDASGAVDTTTALSDFSSGNNPRSAASLDGTSFYVDGGAGGLRYATLAATTSTSLYTTVANLRQVAVFDGQLYVDTGSGTTFRIGTVGTGTPTTAGQSVTPLPGFPTSAGSPYAFLLADLSPTVGFNGTSVDTLYVADDAANAVQKYTFNGTSWAASGSIADTGAKGLTGSVSGSSVALFATNGSTLASFTDTTGYGASVSGSFSTIATAGTNTAFRGVAFAPQAATPTLSIADASVSEGNSGTKTLTFTVTSSAAAPSGGISFTVNTADGSATAGSDYVALINAAGTIAAGQTTTTVSVTINGDTVVEPDETFTATISAPTNATIARGTASGTITNDDAADTTPPTLTASTPADDATGVAIAADIVLTFSEPVKAGTGNIVLRPATGSDVSIPVGSGQVTFNGATVTINPSADLRPGIAYDVIVASGVVTDSAGNAFAGIAQDALDFTTSATIPGGTQTSTFTISDPGTFTLEAGTTRTQTAGTAVSASVANGATTLDIEGTLDDTAARQVAVITNLASGQITVGAAGSVRSTNADAIVVATVNGTTNLTNLGRIVAGSAAFTPAAGGTNPGTGFALNLNAAKGASGAPSTDYASGGVIANGSDGNTAATIRSDDGDAIRLGSHQTLVNYGTILADGPVNDSSSNNSFNGANGNPNTSTASTYDVSRGVRLNQSGATSVRIENHGAIQGAQHGVDVGQANVTGLVVNNLAGALILGRNGSGVGADTLGSAATTVTVSNHGTIRGEYAPAYDRAGYATIDGDGDGVDVDGAATVNNYAGGLIAGSGANGVLNGQGSGGFDSNGRANNSEGLSLGGGIVVNDGTISGATAAIVVNNDSNADKTRSGVAATSIVNGKTGTIIGQSGYAIRLENKTGTAAIDADTIVNAGTITGNGAIPSGTVNRQDGNPDPGVSGTLDGVAYGSADAGNARFIRGDGYAIQTGEGADTVSNYGTITGTNGRAISLEGGADTLNLYTGSSVDGRIDGGAGSDTLNLRLDDRSVTAASGLGSLGANSGVTTGTLAGVANVETLSVQGGSWSITDAQSYATGIVIASGARLTLTAAGALTGSGAIADDGVLAVDETGAVTIGSAISGAGSVAQLGSGTTTLAVAGSYTGGTALGGGTLDVAVAGAAGSGAITFGSGASQTLRIENAALSNGAFANTIAGLETGDAVDVRGIGTATTATLGSGNTLTLTGGDATATLQLDPGQNFAGKGFALTADGAGGTLVTLTEAPSLSIADVTVGEGAGSATFTVTRTGGTGALTVAYATSNGSALAGSDYTAASGTIAFAAGQSSATVTVPILDDTAVEAAESFSVALSSPTNGAVLARAAATGTITDNDVAAPAVLISQVYGGGGNSGATFKNDFIELYNPGSSAVDLSGWSVQYASATGTSWQVTNLSGTIQPGRYYLVQEASGTSGTTGLPTPDAIGTIALSGTAGKVALSSSTTAFTGSSPSGTALIDFVGFGTANASEGGSPAPAPSNTTADIRTPVGQDTDVNSADFVTGAPNPHNSAFVPAGATPTVSINSVSVTEGDSGTKTLDFTVTRSDTATAFTVEVATADGTATAGSDYVAKTQTLSFAAGGPASQTFSVTINGDTLSESDETFTAKLSNLVNTTGATTVGTATGTGTITNDDGATITKISAVQGSGSASPLVGQTVTVEAIVVGDFQNGDADTKRDLGGFYLQEEAADQDANPLTSEGVFIYEGSGNLLTNVAEGDRVRVTGVVTEFNGETQITVSGASNIQVVQAGALSAAQVKASAVAVDLPASGIIGSGTTAQPDLERYEGMLVKLPQTLTITEQFNLDRFNEIRLAQGGRIETFTNEFEPNAANYAAYLAQSAARSIVYDDGANTQNLPIDNLDGFAPYSTATAYRMGDTVTGLTGVLGFGPSSAYRVRAIDDGDNSFVHANPRPAQPDDVGGTLKVGSFNVLNYFKTLDASSSSRTAIGLEPRGANTSAEFARQTEKLANTIIATGADLLGLTELENDFKVGSSGNAVAYLVDQLNAKAGAGTYAWINPGDQLDSGQFLGGDAIAVGFVYKPSKVSVAANTTIQKLDDTDVAALDPSLLQQSTQGHIFNGANTNRASLAVTFHDIGTNEDFTAVINHFKSKGGTGTGADADQNDGQGAWQQQRELASKALTEWLATKPTGTADNDVILFGDFNAYIEEDALDLIKAAGFTNLAEDRLANPYSYVFDAAYGALDHAFANGGLNRQVTGVTEWHVNADEADALDYNLDFNRPASYFDGSVIARESDHDPILLGLRLDATAPTLVSSSPADNATGVAAGANIVLTFSEAVKAGSGSITLTDGAGDVRTIAIGDTTQVSVSGSTVTINPSADLKPGTAYDVIVPNGAITDTAGNAFAGLARDQLDFTVAPAADVTAPTLVSSSPADNATGVAAGANIVLTFSEAVKAGSGNLTITNGAGDVRTIAVNDASQITFSGTTATINPSADLRPGTAYDVIVPNGAITDTAGNAFAGLAQDQLDFTTQGATAVPYTLQILHASDWEAGLLATRRAPNFAAIIDKLEDATPNSITLSTGDGWIPSPFFIAGADPQLAATYNGVYNQLYGLTGSAAYSKLAASPGRADITIQNIIGVQAAVFGNHEFDSGPTEVANIIGANLGTAAGAADDTWVGAQFPYLSVNLNFSRENALSGLVHQDGDAATFAETGPTSTQTGTGADKIAKSTIITENGEKILFVGATTQLEPLLTTLGNVTLDGFSGQDNIPLLAQQINGEIDRQLAANPGVNKVIVGTHLQQLANERALAPLLKNADVLIGGGSHTLLSDGNDRLLTGDTSGGAYPQFFTNASGQPIALVNTASEYSYVGRLTVTFDDQGNIIPSSSTAENSGAVAVDDATVTQLYGSLAAAFTPGSKGYLVREVIEGLDANNDGVQETAGIADVIRQQDGNILGRTSVYLEGRRGEVRTEETNLGDLSADANLWYAKQFDKAVTVSIKNGGGIRDSIGSFSTAGGGTAELPPAANPEAGKQAGDISQLDVTNSLRFNNALSLVTVTAAEMERILEHGVAVVAPGATPGQFSQVGGISYAFDATKQAQTLDANGNVTREGQRIVSAAIIDDQGHILDTLVQNGQLVGDANREIRVVTLDFLATGTMAAPGLGGDNYPFPAYGENKVILRDATPTSLPNTETFAAQGSEQDAIAEYLKAFYTETPYGMADTGPAGDLRIQNLAARADTVLQRGIVLNGTDGNDVLRGTNFNDLLSGGRGDDTIFNSPGDDILLGGSGPNGTGNDTLVFNSAFADVSVSQSGRYTVVTGPEGRDLISGFERLQFTDTTIVVGDGAPLVDDLFYLAANKDVFRAGVDADTHYATFGFKEGRDPNAFFSTTGYLAANPSVAQSGVNPLSQYDSVGWKQGSDPSAGFDDELYLARNPDVKAAGVDPLVHYLTFGQAEGRDASAAVGRATDIETRKGFDAEYYLLSNPDVAKGALAQGGDTFAFAAQHFETTGWKEGRNPNSVFDTKGYLNAYADVKAAGINPLTHFDLFGWKEGRDPSTAFDTTDYLAAYKDVAAAKVDPMLHYLEFGALEGRNAFADGHFG